MGDNGEYPKGLLDGLPTYADHVKARQEKWEKLNQKYGSPQPPITPQRPAASMLHEAARIVAGDRNETHGAAERSFQAIANLWNAYLAGSKGGDLTPVDVCWMMTLLKVARAANGKPTRDHFVDAAGYAALAGELVCDE